MRILLAILAIGLFIAFVTCMATALWVEHEKHVLAGVQWNHFALKQNGRLFYVRRGGGPIETRSQVAMSSDQYQAWEEGGKRSLRWALTGAGFFAAWWVGFIWPVIRATAATSPRC